MVGADGRLTVVEAEMAAGTRCAKGLSMLWANETDVLSRSVMLGLVERLECSISRALSGDISSLRLPAFSLSAISISSALISTGSNVKIEASLPQSSSVFRRKLETPFHDDKFARAVGCKWLCLIHQYRS